MNRKWIMRIALCRFSLYCIIITVKQLFLSDSKTKSSLPTDGVTLERLETKRPINYKTHSHYSAKFLISTIIKPQLDYSIGNSSKANEENDIWGSFTSKVLFGQLSLWIHEKLWKSHTNAHREKKWGRGGTFLNVIMLPFIRKGNSLTKWLNSTN